MPSESRSGPACAAPISAPSVVAPGLARVEREALSVLCQALVERAERHPGLGDHGHVVGLVGDDAVHPRERDAEHRGRAANFAERARGAERRERDAVGFAFADELGDFVAVAGSTIIRAARASRPRGCAHVRVRPCSPRIAFSILST